MASVLDRKIGCILGSAVADAAAQPLHWIYNTDKLDDLIRDAEEIEFWEPSANPFYCIPTGSQSCYGDQAFVMLESLVACKGYNEEDLKQRMYKMFGPGSQYDNPIVDQYTWKADLKKEYPLKTPWKHFSIKHFLKCYKAGNPKTGLETDEQIDCCAKIAPLVAWYAGDQEMLERVEDFVRVTQDSDLDVALALAYARILEKYILDGPVDDVIEHVIRELNNPKRNYPQDLDKGVVNFLRQVLNVKDRDHLEVARKEFRND
ncbi:unnamed protein product [Owenia fusiformis]|uniref:Uncharacterized protein n=1 Tax=Owenia fusiformis TaxID=6347 RepID=A0A8J1UD48_OWEFU|nr:unnamed protein product [Owenia fusiformis]